MQPDLFTALHPALAERIRPANNQPANTSGQFVLYWMHHALRTSENPALDAARTVAATLHLPLLVLHTIPSATPYASDRLHTFQLQAARDVATQLAGLSITYALHLPRREHTASGDQNAPPVLTPPALTHLANRASLVITEDMPVFPWRTWIDTLSDELDTAAVAMWAVDTACIVPMQLCERAHDRAFTYRNATRKLREQRVRRPWPALALDTATTLPFTGALPFTPPVIANATDADIANLVSACDIDHTIGPVPHTQGGSTAAESRWNSFKARGLTRYADTRNNALIDGVSRMSAYLHYGMISPLAVARDASLNKSEGAAKYLDELMVWREVAYTWCFFRDDHDRLSGIPAWAKQTLAAHERDPRPALPSWETLARAKTGDAVWDAAQSSLLVHGELHNNVRMTWGKALLNWTPDAARCLQLLIDLNHRYALDGRDPASFGGLVWCLGLFDRPFAPEQRILGTVRPRPTREQAKRLDPAKYAQRTGRPVFHTLNAGDAASPRIAVIGAGLAGLLCARTLADHKLTVTVFDKGRGPGGRISTRITETYQFDHGGQYFTARSPLLQRLAASWMHDNIIAPWQPRLVDLLAGVATPHNSPHNPESTHPRYVGTPTMSALTEHLAHGIIDAGGKISYGTEVTRAEKRGNHWALLATDSNKTETDLGLFNAIIFATPPANIRKALGPSQHAAPTLAAIAPVTMLPTWALMLAFDRPLDLPFDGAFIKNDVVLAWAAKDNTKPGRRPGPQPAPGKTTCADDLWVLHATHEWSAANLDLTADDAAALMLASFNQLVRTLTGNPAPQPAYSSAHRWRYAAVGTPLGQPCWLDTTQSLGLCGDWCDTGPSKIEKALLSGAAMAGRLMSMLAGQTRAESSNTPQTNDLFSTQ